jgi:hypothetical protein
MGIRVKKLGEDLYTAELLVPDMDAVREPWATPEPMRGRELTLELLAPGCHQTAVGDAMSLADPQWAASRHAVLLIQKLQGQTFDPSRLGAKIFCSRAIRL